MISGGATIVFEKSIGQNTQLKVINIMKIQEQPEVWLRIDQGDEVISEKYLGLLRSKAEATREIDIITEQLIQLISNEQTLFNLTEKMELNIQNKQKTFTIKLKSKESSKEGFKNNQYQEKISKLQQLISEQSNKHQALQNYLVSIIKTQGEDIETLKTQFREVNQQLSAAKLSLTILAKKFQEQEAIVSPLVIQQQEFRCFHHPYNPHSHHFTLRLTPQCLKIIKTSDNISHNFISNLSILPGKVTTFHVKQVRVIDGQVYMGVGTKSVFGDINSWNRDFLSYYSGDGDVCENGLYHKGGEQIRDGQVLTIKVDLISQNVSWWLENKQLAQVKLPEQMRDQHLYLVLLMKHKGDELNLLLDEFMS